VINELPSESHERSKADTHGQRTRRSNRGARGTDLGANLILRKPPKSQFSLALQLRELLRRFAFPVFRKAAMASRCLARGLAYPFLRRFTTV
jgi:hypothetical protein